MATTSDPSVAAPAGSDRPVAGPNGSGPPKRRRGPSDEPFLRRYFRVPGPLGIVVVVLALAVGTGFVGALIWASNDARNVRSTPSPPVTERPQVDSSDVQPTTTTLPDLSADTIGSRFRPALWSVRTFDSAGRPTQGSAFLARSSKGQSLLLTSLAVVEASTHLPAPDIVVAGEGFDGKAQLWSWDEEHDLALLIVGATEESAPPWVGDSARLKEGAKVFAVGGDGILKPGVVTGLSDQVVEHNIFIDDALRGGAIVDVKGEVVAVASAVFTAGGNPTDTAFFGIPVRDSCDQVLTCTGAFAGPDAATVASVPAAATTTTPTTTVR